MGKDK